MRVVSARAYILFEQVMTVLAAGSGKFSIDDYFFPSMLSNAKRLEEALDAAISVGLLDEIITDKDNALSMYTAFVQALLFASTKTDSEGIQEAFCKDHLTLGLVRLLDVSLRFRENILPAKLRASTAAYVKTRADLAWNYLRLETTALARP